MADYIITDNGASVTVEENGKTVTVGKNLASIDILSAERLQVTSTSGGLVTWIMGTNDTINLPNGTIIELHEALEGVFFS